LGKFPLFYKKKIKHQFEEKTPNIANNRYLEHKYANRQLICDVMII
jgi:hypothetical protein